MNENFCCFFGHRKVEITDELRNKLCNSVEKLIVEENIDTFLFGSRSQFDDLCYQIVSELKEEYHCIKRIYVRAQFPYINDDYKSYLLQRYEETYYPDSILKAGKSSYVERNCEMINKSKFCVICYDEANLNGKQRSGTKIAYEYAVKHSKKIINLLKA